MRFCTFLMLFTNLISAEATSFTDQSFGYKASCLKACEDNNFFNNFRRSDPYFSNLGEPNNFISQSCFEYISSKSPVLLENFSLFSPLDCLGNPYLFKLHPNITCSGATIRYVGILADLIEHFESLDNKEVVEIGGGFGGQCYVLSKWFNIKSYTIIDLPEVIALQKKVLSILGITNVKFLTPQEVDKKLHYDFVISNYAFSECIPSMQKIYLENVIKNSLSGYMIMNDLRRYIGKNTMSKEDIINEVATSFSSCSVTHEFVESFKYNYTIHW